MHPEIMSILVDDRIHQLQHDARRPRKATPSTRVDETAVHLRLCRVDDDPALEALAQLEGRPLADGRYVVAETDGRLVAALPLAGGTPFADPFARTAHLLPLLALRAAQVRGKRRRRFVPALGLLPRRA